MAGREAKFQIAATNRPFRMKHAKSNLSSRRISELLILLGKFDLGALEVCWHDEEARCMVYFESELHSFVLHN